MSFASHEYARPSLSMQVDNTSRLSKLLDLRRVPTVFIREVQVLLVDRYLLG